MWDLLTNKELAHPTDYDVVGPSTGSSIFRELKEGDFLVKFFASTTRELDIKICDKPISIEDNEGNRVFGFIHTNINKDIYDDTYVFSPISIFDAIELLEGNNVH